jgi:hypothetical protein
VLKVAKRVAVESREACRSCEWDRVFPEGGVEIGRGLDDRTMSIVGSTGRVRTGSTSFGVLGSTNFQILKGRASDFFDSSHGSQFCGPSRMIGPDRTTLVEVDMALKGVGFRSFFDCIF